MPVLIGPGASVGELTAPLEQTRDLAVLPNAAAAAHFESAGSSEPGLLTDEQLQRLMSALGEGTKQLASGRREKAERQLAALEKLDPKARDYLQRSPERAQALFQECLLTAKILQDEKQPEAAAQHMERCVRMFPGYEPMSGIHAATRKSFEEARARLAEEPHGTVELLSDRDGCVVRANGLALGTTPLTISLPVGYFRFQVECTQDLGRVHALSVQPGDTRVTIDTHLDSVVHTQGALWLAYPDKASRDAQMDRDGLVLSRLLDSSHVVLLVVESGRMPIGPVQVRVRALDPTPHDLGTLVFADARYAGEVGAVTRQLVATARRVVPETDAPAVSSAPALAPSAPSEATDETPDEGSDEPPAEPSSSALPLIAASAMGVLGTGSLAVAWVAYAERFNLRTQLYFDSIPFSTRRDFRSAGTWALSLGAAGAALLAAAEPFVLPRADGMPTAAWVAGGAGVAVAAVGLGFGVFGRHCEPAVVTPGRPGCGAFVADATFGPLLALHAIPLLAVPITYAIRHWLESDDVALSFGDRELILSGRF